MGLFRNNGDKLDKWADKLGEKMVAWGEKQMKRLEVQQEEENQREARRRRMEEMMYSRDEYDEDDSEDSDWNDEDDGPIILTYNQRTAQRDAKALQELKGAFEPRWHEQVTTTFNEYRKLFGYYEIIRVDVPHIAIKIQTVNALSQSNIFPVNNSWR